MKDVLDKFSELLYSVAPGFVVLFGLWVADSENKLGVQTILFAKDYEWRGVGTGILFGLVSYALHLAVFEDWMVRIAIRPTTRVNDASVYSRNGCGQWRFLVTLPQTIY